MGNLSIDFDDLARDMGETLDMCEYAVKAAKSPESEFERKPNFSKALLSCVGVEAVAKRFHRSASAIQRIYYNK